MHSGPPRIVHGLVSAAFGAAQNALLPGGRGLRDAQQTGLPNGWRAAGSILRGGRSGARCAALKCPGELVWILYYLTSAPRTRLQLAGTLLPPPPPSTVQGGAAFKGVRDGRGRCDVARWRDGDAYCCFRTALLGLRPLLPSSPCLCGCMVAYRRRYILLPLAPLLTFVLYHLVPVRGYYITLLLLPSLL